MPSCKSDVKVEVILSDFSGLCLPSPGTGEADSISDAASPHLFH